MAAEVIHTGVPCSRGHDAPRYAKSRGCVVCTREDNLKQLAKNGDARRQASRDWLKRNRAHANAWSVEWRKSNPEKTMLAAARKASKNKGVPFDLKTTDITIPEFCPVLGIPLVRGEGDRSGNSPSLDRIKPALGYVKGNVMVISWRANRIKADATFEELAAVADFYRRLGAN